MNTHYHLLQDTYCSTMQHVIVNGEPIGTIEKKIQGFSVSSFVAKKSIRVYSKERAIDFILRYHYELTNRNKPIQTTLQI